MTGKEIIERAKADMDKRLRSWEKRLGMDICKACGANREVVFQGMTEGYESDNAQNAIKIIKNCEACKKAYIKNLDELCELIP